MEVTAALQSLDSAAADKRLSPAAAANIRRWLTESRYAEYAPQVLDHITAGQWQTLDDVFWTVIPFGTGGRRGKMYPIGCNAINDRTIGESAQGLADYVVRVQRSGVRSQATGDTPPSEPRTPNPELSCAIAYDTRHNSRRFAELCAGIMVANGFRVYFLDDYRSTPELSFLVRHKQCDCGIMVTASHNPPSDNAVKVYWSTGGQVVPPHDRGIVEQVGQVEEIRRTDFQEAVADGRIVLCKEEIDELFIQQVAAQGTPGPRNVRIIYSPLHGVGEFAAVPALVADGFRDLEIYPPHRTPDGDFPNVPGHVSNPANPDVFTTLISRAVPAGADLVLATDPDCDRMGCAAPISKHRKHQWTTFGGNQLSALLTDYVCRTRQAAGQLTSEHFVVTTLVTTPLVRRIATSYGVRTIDNVHVGFKWIAQAIDAHGSDRFLFGTEESHGFLIGQYVRDKDGAAACLLMAELAAQVKAEKQTLMDRLESLYWGHGYHAERQLNLFMTGSAGMARMQALMQRFRTSPPESLGGIRVQQVRDYLHLTTTPPGGAAQPLAAPRGDMVIFDLAIDGHYIAVRPSGTEPKIKFYLFTYVPPAELRDLDQAREAMNERLAAVEAELRTIADAV
jgi:phosphoglucomutase/phosphomannomutase